jgi:hypothetical protein
MSALVLTNANCGLPSRTAWRATSRSTVRNLSLTTSTRSNA